MDIIASEKSFVIITVCIISIVKAPARTSENSGFAPSWSKQNPMG
jgi:hypothetical protein